jgi:DNA/RNA endonuclease G (NUC1)
MPVQFEYIARADEDNCPRSQSFPLDETQGMEEWQPPGWRQSYKYGSPWEVGHLVPANHFDSYKELIDATNLMTNVVPQLGDMNKRAWLATEYITECARQDTEKENVFVMGGCVWDEEKPKDLLKEVTNPNEAMKNKFSRHNYKLFIPDYCWKVLSTPNRGHVAFYIPNNKEARISIKIGEIDGVEEGLTALSEFVVSVNELEEHLEGRQMSQKFTLPEYEKKDYEDKDYRQICKKIRSQMPQKQYENKDYDECIKDYKPTAEQMQQSGWSLKCDKK